jgi:hypothetical protein
MQPRIDLRLLLVAILALAACTNVWSAELAPTLEDGQLGGVLRAVNLPPTIKKDLVSGLTNRIVIRISLLSSRQVVAQAVADVAVKYDLWDETFSMKVNVDDRPQASRTGYDVDDVITTLANLNLPHLFQADSVLRSGPLQLEAEILFDPIEKARMEEIRKWVEENDHVAPPDAASLSSILPVPRSASARLFNRIFEQYASGASLAATWKQTVVSTPFTMDDLRHGLQHNQ